MKSKPWDYTALTLLILGALNWGLIGLFKFDLVATIFGGMESVISRVIYCLIALAGLYGLSMYGRLYHDDLSTTDR